NAPAIAIDVLALRPIGTPSQSARPLVVLANLAARAIREDEAIHWRIAILNHFFDLARQPIAAQHGVANLDLTHRGAAGRRKYNASKWLFPASSVALLKYTLLRPAPMKPVLERQRLVQRQRIQVAVGFLSREPV